MFHKFYSACRVKGEAEDIMRARLALCKAVKTAIKNCTEILKVDCPEKM